MRVLISLLHVHPLVPIARALRDAGHDVLFACGGRDGAILEALGFRCHVFEAFRERGLGELIVEMARRSPEIMARGPAWISTREGQQWGTVYGFGGAIPRTLLPELLELIERWEPDVVVRDSSEMASCVAAEAMGVPHSAVQVGAFLDDHMLTAHYRQALVEQLNGVRAAAGLAADPDMEMLYRYLHLSFTPPSYDSITTALPATIHYVRTEVFDRSGHESLPGWVAQLPARPTVNVTLGLAMFNRTPGVFPAILAGLAAEDINVVATIGRGNDVAALGALPDNVHAEQYIPQSLLFPHCDLVVTHGGWTSTMAAFAHGLPQVVVPIGADQPMNALRVASLDAGRVVPLAELSPESVRAAVRDVLDDDRYRASARRVQAEMASLPGMDHAVALLEGLAAGGVSIHG